VAFVTAALDGAYLGSVGAFLDTFALARQHVERLYAPHGGFTVQTQTKLLSLTGGPLRVADGRSLVADGPIGADERHALVHLASFVVGGDTEAVEARLAQAAPLYPWLQAQHDAGALISAAGAAVFLIAEAGLLDGGLAAVPRPLAPIFRRRYPRVRISSTSPIAEHGRVLTGGGLGVEPQLLLRLVELRMSPHVAGWLAAATGFGAADEDVVAEDPLVADAQLWLRARFAEEVQIKGLADSLAVSHQTLIRRFRSQLAMTPMEYVQRLRLEAAQGMLERTDRPIAQIAQLVGYRDVRFFRRLFRSRYGTSASQHRAERRRKPKASPDRHRR
jgi:transcriptional regulator GlxA family with amidase domain